MPSEETRRLLKIFGVAVTNLEDALDRKVSGAEIAKLDAELADRLRDVIALIDLIRSRRFA